jgi:hypothetical protein
LEKRANELPHKNGNDPRAEGVIINFIGSGKEETFKEYHFPG